MIAFKNANLDLFPLGFGAGCMGLEWVFAGVISDSASGSEDEAIRVDWSPPLEPGEGGCMSGWFSSIAVPTSACSSASSRRADGAAPVSAPGVDETSSDRSSPFMCSSHSSASRDCGSPDEGIASPNWFPGMRLVPLEPAFGWANARSFGAGPTGGGVGENVRPRAIEAPVTVGAVSMPQPLVKPVRA